MLGMNEDVLVFEAIADCREMHAEEICNALADQEVTHAEVE